MGCACMRVADVAMTTVWPLFWWARTNRHAPWKSAPAISWANSCSPEFHQVVFGAAHPNPDSLQHQVFERGFVERAAERGTQRAHELVGSEFEITGAVSDESAGRVALDQGSVEVEECRELSDRQGRT